MNGMKESINGFVVFSDLVVHQTEIRVQFRNVRLKIDGLPIEVRGNSEIAPGLSLLRRGQERFEIWRLLRENYAH